MTEHTTPTEPVPTKLPHSLGSDQEAREGLERELWVADVDSTTEPRRVAIDYTDNAHRDQTTTTELGWFDIDTMIRQLAEFAPDLVVMRREEVPDVIITKHIDAPTTCVVNIGGVRRFAGADWSAHPWDVEQLREQLAKANIQIKSLAKECQRKNSDCEQYANERREAIEARNEIKGDLDALTSHWRLYDAALARLEDTTKPQVIGQHVVMRHETLTQLETECDQLANSNVTTDQLDQERRDHEETRRELRAMTAHARRWQRFAAVIELMEDANQAELIIDGVRITPVAGVRTKATKE